MPKRLPQQIDFWLCAVAVLALAYCTPFRARAQTTWRVDDNAPLEGDGTSWEDAFKYLQDALELAESGDEIRVAGGTYKPDQDEDDPNTATPGDRTATFALIDGVQIKGGYAGWWVDPDVPGTRDIGLYASVLSGDLLDNDYCDSLDDNSYHVVSAWAEDEITTAAVLDGFTITAGNADDDTDDCEGPGYGSGAGLYNEEGSPEVRNCTFVRNQSRCYGAGMANFDATDPSSQPIILNCVFEENWAGKGATGESTGGGGIYNGDGDDGSSGYGRDPTIGNCLFVYNKVGHNREDHWHDGGGICNDNSDPNVFNCIFIGNSVENNGGAIANRFDSSPTITNCTIVENEAGYFGPGYGGGIYNKHSDNDAPTVTNCILWGNIDDGSGESSQIYGGDPNVTYTCIEDCDVGTGGFCDTGENYYNIYDEPDFLAPNHGDYYLQYDSPCIDAGTNTPPGGLPSDDFDGNDRIVDGDDNGSEVVDMGAYEYDPDAVRICAWPTAFTFVAAYDNYNLPLVETFYVSNCGGGTVNWTIEEECSWLEVDPNSGQDVDEVALSVVDVAGLEPGRYDCWFKVVDDQASNNPVPVRVTLYVGQVLYVDDNAPNDPGPGNPLVSDPNEDGSEEHPFDAIQEAVDHPCCDTDTVLVLDGEYTGEGNRDIELKGINIIVRSANGPTNCIIDCESDDRAFYIHDDETADAMIEGFTIINGDAGYGGAIYCNYTTPTIRNCIFTGNVADYKGGGIHYRLADGASATLLNCDFIENVAEHQHTDDHGGGGVYCILLNESYTGAITVTNCTFNGNWGRWGGGLYVQYADVTVTNCTFVDNEARPDYAGVGGGVYLARSGNTSIVNCSFTGNTAYDDEDCCGGAVFSHNCDPAITITNCVVWDNVPEEQQINYGGDNPPAPAVTYCDVEDDNWGGEDNHNISEDPYFVYQGAGDLRLLSNSPCIDAGDDDALPPDTFDLDQDGDTQEPIPFDLDGNPRIQLCAVDMGAYEAGTSCVADLDLDGDCDLADLAELLAHYGETTGMGYLDGDLDCDGDVDLSDLAELLGHYGDDCGGDGDGDGEDGGGGGGGEDGGGYVDVSVVAYDTGGYTGDGFNGEVDHFVFDLKIEVNDPNNDDWVVTGAVLDTSNDATFRLSLAANYPNQYATFVAAPWTTLPELPNASVVGAYDPPDPDPEFTTTGINLGWYDMAESNDGPATVMRLVIDVSEVKDADVSEGFGSVYFSTTGKIGKDDILVADLDSGTCTAESAPDLKSLSGEFYVKGE